VLRIKDAQVDNGAVFFNGKVDGMREGIDGLHAYIVVADSRCGGQAADGLEIGIQRVGELKAEAGGVVIA